jgi:hypothetical protein
VPDEPQPIDDKPDETDDLPPEAREWVTWHNAVKKETDRGAVLMSTSYLEECLRRHLRAAMIADLTEAECQHLFDSNGPLATFSACIDLSFSIALIGRRMRRQLHLFRRIRNDFAHQFVAISLDRPPVRDRCRELVVDIPPGISISLTDREHFEMAAFNTFGWFQGTTRQIRRMGWARLNSFDLAELNETEREAWMQQVIRVQQGLEKPFKTWFNG